MQKYLIKSINQNMTNFLLFNASEFIQNTSSKAASFNIDYVQQFSEKITEQHNTWIELSKGLTEFTIDYNNRLTIDEDFVR